MFVARSPGRGQSPLVFAIFGSIQPGKILSNLTGALIPFGGKEVVATDYEVLMDAGIWIRTSGGVIPDAAIVCGRESSGEPLFVARASFGGGLQLGKASFSLGGAFDRIRRGRESRPGL